jgi:hypothetical protein
MGKLENYEFISFLACPLDLGTGLSPKSYLKIGGG